jgi:hypothetical protein
VHEPAPISNGRPVRLGQPDQPTNRLPDNDIDNDRLINQLFAISLDMAALVARVDDQHVADGIYHAVNGLDEAISTLYRISLDRHRRVHESTESGTVRTR